MNPLIGFKKATPVFLVWSALVCVSLSPSVTGTKPAVSRTEAATKVSHPAAAGLTFAERVVYQRIIEDVYWRHRIWPKENPDPKPSLDAVMSQAQLERKVTDYLRDSLELEDYWQKPITAEQLQAEMNRMAQHTRQPQVLHEVFEALGNDPFVIAECLARPVLAERLLIQSASEHVTPPRQTYEPVAAATGNYSLPSVSDNGGCTDDTWTATSTRNAPSVRYYHTAVWTGSEMIIWGGNYSNTGGRYNPTTDSWAATNTTNAPSFGELHTAVWTGSEMIVWGGYTNTGGRYNPGTDSWTATSTTNAPAFRESHTAVWTGTQMIVWGGDAVGPALNTGGRYDPSTDHWIATSTSNAPLARTSHTAVWTGNQMIVWGGNNGVFILNTGGKYNPSTDSWIPTSTTNTPVPRTRHKAVWTGTEMIVWGGGNDFESFHTGGRYDPATNSWKATSINGAPAARLNHTAVWTGNEMIVWGGGDAGIHALNSGGRYNPEMNSWTATSTANAPSPRYFHTAVWTGNEMIVWGGTGARSNIGGRYCAPGSQLGNISSRSLVQTGDNVMIGGFIVKGPATKRVIIRAIGPELTQYGVPDALTNPTLELHDSTGALIASNDNWRTTIIGGIITSGQRDDIRNSGYAPADGRESAIIAELPAGNYTAIVRGVNNTMGIALVEVYDLSPDTNSVLSNISTRSFVQTGDNVMIGGVIVRGTEPRRVIVRAIGPDLTQYSVPNALADPTLELHDATGALIASNDNWQHTIIGGIITRDQVRDIQNSGYAPGDGRESAIIAELPPGDYTAIIRGVNNTTGVALVEVYDLDR